MRRIVRKKQQNSKSCLVCGLQNDFGLQASFYELDSNELLATFTPQKHHQGYPGRLHGGMASTILDETIGRAIMINHPGQFGVTLEITVQFKMPVPLSDELRVVSRITKDSSRFFKGSGEIILADGSIGVTAQGKYLKMDLDKIADFDEKDQHWKVVALPEDPTFFEF